MVRSELRAVIDWLTTEGKVVGMTITERETQQIDEANGSGRTAVVFIHGLWLLPSSWDQWRQAFEQAGYRDTDTVVAG